MKVSLCMIVKNEVEVLERCLDSVTGLVDEVVIVDTGSTDGTLDVVRERANVWEQRAWNGFSDARNRSIELATGDVILVLDADEAIVRTPDLEAQWKEALRLLEEESDGVAFRIRNILPRGQILQADLIWQIRLFRNEPRARYSGRVHNQLVMNLQNAPRNGRETKFHQVKVEILHTGYNLTPEERKLKYEQRIPDLLEEIQRAESEKIWAYYVFQACNAYFMIGDQEKALDMARLCTLSQLTLENQYSLCMMAVHCSMVAEEMEECQRWALKMMEIWPQEPMSFLMYGLALLGKNNQGAYNLLGSTLALCELPRTTFKYQLDPAYVAGAAGEAAFALGRYGEAKHLFQLHLAEHENPRIQQLEAAIVPVGEDPEDVQEPEAQEVPSGLVEEKTQIPDLRKTG